MSLAVIVTVSAKAGKTRRAGADLRRGDEDRNHPARRSERTIPHPPVVAGAGSTAGRPSPRPGTDANALPFV
ncbi:hypothetical protein ME121_5251 [Methylobacterium sp. ME121]|nr:hypothetical protein ME121_5251 [Methylobacterium sp. ME121]